MYRERRRGASAEPAFLAALEDVCGRRRGAHDETGVLVKLCEGVAALGTSIGCNDEAAEAPGEMWGLNLLAPGPRRVERGLSRPARTPPRSRGR